MEELFTESKKIKNLWYYFLNFYFWFSIILLAILIILGIIIYFKYVLPNLENYKFVIKVIENSKSLAEEFLNITYT